MNTSIRTTLGLLMMCVAAAAPAQLPTDAPLERLTPPAPAPSADGQGLAYPAVLNTSDPSCRPEFPPSAVRARAQGVTQLQFVIEPNGHVQSVTVLRSAGETPAHKLLDQSAADALRTCPFTPGRDASGRRVGLQVVLTYTWHLE